MNMRIVIAALLAAFSAGLVPAKPMTCCAAHSACHKAAPRPCPMAVNAPTPQSSIVRQGTQRIEPVAEAIVPHELHRLWLRAVVRAPRPARAVREMYLRHRVLLL
jgi:hypothetical protein